MKSAARAMYAISIFLFIMTVIYAIASVYVKDGGYQEELHIEVAGMTGLTLAFLMTMMLGVYLHFTDNRSDVTPDNWEEAEIADNAGVLGFFSPSSIWPFTMSCAVAVLGFGIIFMFYWLIIVGAVMLVWSTVMLNIQYGMPREKH